MGSLLGDRKGREENEKGWEGTRGEKAWEGRKVMGKEGRSIRREREGGMGVREGGRP